MKIEVMLPLFFIFFSENTGKWGKWANEHAKPNRIKACIVFP